MCSFAFRMDLSRSYRAFVFCDAGVQRVELWTNNRRGQVAHAEAEVGNDRFKFFKKFVVRRSSDVLFVEVFVRASGEDAIGCCMFIVGGDDAAFARSLAFCRIGC